MMKEARTGGAWNWHQVQKFGCILFYVMYIRVDLEGSLFFNRTMGIGTEMAACYQRWHLSSWLLTSQSLIASFHQNPQFCNRWRYKVPPLGGAILANYIFKTLWAITPPCRATSERSSKWVPSNLGWINSWNFLLTVAYYTTLSIFNLRNWQFRTFEKWHFRKLFTSKMPFF